jgi:hypothetical protein
MTLTSSTAAVDKNQAIAKTTERLVELIGHTVDLSLVEYLIINRECVGAHYVDGSEDRITSYERNSNRPLKVGDHVKTKRGVKTIFGWSDGMPQILLK